MTHPSGATHKYEPGWLDRAKRAEGGPIAREAADVGRAAAEISDLSKPNTEARRAAIMKDAKQHLSDRLNAAQEEKNAPRSILDQDRNEASQQAQARGDYDAGGNFKPWHPDEGE